MTDLARPVRLQLSRRKGFRLLDHSLAVNGLPAVNVSRPGRWGNPFVVGGRYQFHSGDVVMSRELAVEMFEFILGKIDRAYPSNNQIREELRNRNLACWCRSDQRCHADVLLEIANEDYF